MAFWPKPPVASPNLAQAAAVPVPTPAIVNEPADPAEPTGDPLPEAIALTRVSEAPLRPPLLGPSSGEDLADALVPAAAAEAGQDAALVRMAPSGNVSESFPIDAGRAGDLGGNLTFMGIQSVGQRFCIIADHSGSMAGNKLEHVKAEVLRTLANMKGAAKFYIIFFDDRAMPLPGGRWMEGRRDVPKVAPWVNGVQASGGTEPLPAFEAAFELNPRPDVIFFMTDGIFARDVPDEIAKLNQPAGARERTIIHTIAFVDRGGEVLLRQIAAQSGGKFNYVPGNP